VHLQVDRDGNVSSHLIVERTDTLDLLRRDAPTLERALHNAGLKTADQGLEFSLRDQGLARDQGNRDEGGASRIIVVDPAPIAPAAYGRRLGIGAGIDIRV
jgi:flagellar hook-length control protein FliK